MPICPSPASETIGECNVEEAVDHVLAATCNNSSILDWPRVLCIRSRSSADLYLIWCSTERGQGSFSTS
jgi:hypothetical protein